MAVINFPDSPSDGDTQDVGGITYTYSSSKGYWTAAASGGAGGGGASVTTDDTAPSSPSDGDLWYDTHDGGMFVYYEDTDSAQWVEVIGSAGAAGADGADGATGPAGADGSAAVYATVDDLPGTASAGDQAFVTASNRLYLWNGSGWYNIALINTTPSISGVSSSYGLAIDGTATTVTITATDPEGLPITYSIASDTSGNIATVTQNANVFTITPSTNTANAGSFSLTFRASDGVNIATAPATFTLQFKVVNQKYTTALITSVGTNNATNSTFVDSSTNSHTITAAGNATQTTFSPYRPGGYSTYFDGSGDNLTTSSAILSTTGGFTVQCWVYLDDTSNAAIWAQGTSGNAARAALSIESGNWYAQIGSAVINTTAAVANVWKFIEFQYDGSQIELFVDGSSVGTASNTTNAENTGLFIGKLWAAGYDLQGYVTDFRVINGTPSGSSTPPTERLTAITNTSLLTCHLPYIADGSTNGHAITVNGNTKTVSFAPYDSQEYTAASHGGSLTNDGTGTNYLSVTSSDFEFGTSDDFVIEAWVYPTATPSGAAQVVDNRGAANGLNLAFTSSNQFASYSEPLSSQLTGTTKTLNQWYHLAVVRYNGTRKLFVNGVSEASVSDTGNYNSNSLIIASRYSTDQQAWAGNISDLRIIRGTIPSSYQGTSLTIPTAPLTAITNTSLLLSGTNAGIIDKSQSVKSLTLNGDVKSSTTQTKYLSSSMYFDGTADYITLSDSDLREFGGNNFTMEFWIKTTISTQYATIISRTPSGFAAGMWTILMNNTVSGGEVAMYLGDLTGNLIFATSGASIRDDSWHHVAVVRNGSTFTCYIDGTSRGSGTWAGSITNINGDIRIGMDQNYIRYFEGYLSDLRITKGLARYTANFTPPTAALQG